MIGINYSIPSESHINSSNIFLGLFQIKMFFVSNLNFRNFLYLHTHFKKIQHTQCDLFQEYQNILTFLDVFSKGKAVS